ncbi:helix-hairpin-helix domain-containing protein [Shewanella sp. S1-58-MNA-CIBAN-0166]|uniref:helix-hairpin-helix domain-containing protein n=1 Tax=Shewanella sp. S1-58-MNA-CIBAN-0166 TaxID=3140467 RepID=UPI00332E4726|tara:strand:+ start:313 stop:1035 length:723 start_codon:yes stop_codon:yes gene_type:complete
MKIFNIIFRLLTSSIYSKPSKQHITLSLKKSADLNNGMIFHPTLQLSTPLWILKKSGEVYTGKGNPPDYGGQKHGIWISKLGSEFDFLDEGSTAASDAGPVDEKQYLKYAIGLLSIFDSTANIHDKMDLASRYSSKNKQLRLIEKKICEYYNEENICNVMSRFIPIEDSLTYFRDKAGFLHLIKGVNRKILSALESEGITTINQLLPLTESDLLKIKGVGKITAANIFIEIHNVIKITRS